MSAPRPASVVVGGLGSPHDRLIAASLRASGVEAHALGPFDDDALTRGRAALPRGQCAPMLYTTGALVRFSSRPEAERSTLVVPKSCGPCRYALFEEGWARALAHAGARGPRLLGLDQTRLQSLLGDRSGPLLEALTCADALAELRRRLLPSVASIDQLEACFDQAIAVIEAKIAGGEQPRRALEQVARPLRALRRAEPRPLARAALVGEPWSLHVEGDGQLHLPRVLARAGVEIDAPPVSLWLAYLAWQARSVRWGAGPAPSPSDIDRARSTEAQLSTLLAEAGEAAGMKHLALPDLDDLAELASPHLRPSLLGGYGHLELGLALRAARDRTAHLVLSVKSFGCIPSSGVIDGLMPSALPLPFLALEIAGDGEAARESRLALRVASALEAAEDETRRASEGSPLPIARLAELARLDPLDPPRPSPRPHACSLACAIAMLPPGTTHPPRPLSASC